MVRSMDRVGVKVRSIIGATEVREVILLLILMVGRLKLPGLIMP
jgi:hypothetical protein